MQDERHKQYTQADFQTLEAAQRMQQQLIAQGFTFDRDPMWIAKPVGKGCWRIKGWKWRK